MPGNKQVFQELLRRAHNFAWDRQWSNAIAAYRRALAEFDNDPQVWVSLGAALLEDKRLPDAKDAYVRASELQPDDIAIQQKLADIYERMGSLENALQTHMYVAMALQKSPTPDKAADAWRAILRLQPAHLDSRRALAELLEHQDRKSEAAQEFVLLARRLQERGRTTDAGDAARRALSLDPRNQEARALAASLQVETPSAEQPAPPPEVVSATDQDSPMHQAAQQSLARLAEPVSAGGQQAEAAQLIAQAVEAQKNGQQLEAIDAYRRAIAAGASQPEIHFQLGMLCAESKRDDDAIAEFTQSAQAPEYALGSQFALGKCYRARGDIQHALEHLLEAVKRVDEQSSKTERVEHFRRLYRALLNQYSRAPDGEATSFADALIGFMSSPQWQEKVRELRSALDELADDGTVLSVAELLNTRQPEEVAASVRNSREYLKRQKYSAAVDECYRGIALAPTYLPLHAQLARTYAAQGREEATVAKYQVMATLQRARGETTQVRQTYKQILSWSPNDADVRTKYIDLLLADEQFAEAVDQYVMLAQAEQEQARSERALEAYHAALRLIPRTGIDRWSLTILHMMGDIYMQRVAWKEALTIYLQLKRMAPQDEKATLRVIELYFKLNRDVEMESELDSLIHRYEQAGDLEHLIPVITDMSALRPRNIALRQRLTDLLVQLGRTDEAIAELDALGEMQLNIGQTGAAMQTVARIISLQPHNVEDYQALLAQLQEGSS